MLSKDWKTMFSYKEYKRIISKYKDISVDFSEAFNRDEFCVIRHDVEFDIDRAEKIALIDCELGIKSSFLFQVRSNAYNIMSIKNMETIKRIGSYGHAIGLHLLIKDDIGNNDWDFVYSEINLQKEMLEHVSGYRVDRFSFHRPKQWVLQLREDYILGLINLYGPSFFELGSDPKHIKYYADSRHKWAYGHPLDYSNYNKFQLLLHPDEWSKNGYDADRNFKKLIKDNTKNFKNTLFEETVYKNNER